MFVLQWGSSHVTAAVGVQMSRGIYKVSVKLWLWCDWNNPYNGVIKCFCYYVTAFSTFFCLTWVPSPVSCVTGLFWPLFVDRVARKGSRVNSHLDESIFSLWSHTGQDRQPIDRLCLYVVQGKGKRKAKITHAESQNSRSGVLHEKCMNERYGHGSVWIFNERMTFLRAAGVHCIQDCISCGSVHFYILLWWWCCLGNIEVINTSNQSINSVKS